MARADKADERAAKGEASLKDLEAAKAERTVAMAAETKVAELMKSSNAELVQTIQSNLEVSEPFSVETNCIQYTACPSH